MSKHRFEHDRPEEKSSRHNLPNFLELFGKSGSGSDTRFASELLENLLPQIEIADINTNLQNIPEHRREQIHDQLDRALKKWKEEHPHERMPKSWRRLFESLHSDEHGSGRRRYWHHQWYHPDRSFSQGDEQVHSPGDYAGGAYSQDSNYGQGGYRQGSGNGYAGDSSSDAGQASGYGGGTYGGTAPADYGGSASRNGVDQEVSTTSDYAVDPSQLQVIEAGGYAFPVSGYQGDVELHWGQNPGAADIFAERGTPVVAMQGGTVRWSRNDAIGGYNVGIRQDDGLTAYYAHMDQPPLVAQGQRVETGQQIGAVGDTGNAKGTGYHLHFAVGSEIISGTGPAGGTGAGVNNYTLLNEILDRA